MTVAIYISGDRVWGLVGRDRHRIEEGKLGSFVQAIAQTPVDVFLDTPSYASAKFPVELRKRRDRKTMAESHFTALAGEEGVGNWYVIPEAGGWQLYLLALDPASVELLLIKEMASSGLKIRSIGSTLMSAVPIESRAESVLRVMVKGSSTQIALQKHGVWVFARRVESAGSEASEAVRDTLLYLQAQGYFDIPYTGHWELVSSDDVFAGLQGLWGSVSPILSLPRRISLDVFINSERIQDGGFNRLKGLSTPALDYNSQPLQGGALSILFLTLAYVLPQLYFTSMKLPSVNEETVQTFPESLQRMHWERVLVKGLEITDSEKVSRDLQWVIYSLDSIEGVVVQELSVNAGRSYRLQCVLSIAATDPLRKRALFNELKNTIALQLTTHRISLQEVDGHSLDSRAQQTHFELMLEYPS